MQEQLIESIDEFAKLKKHQAATQILAFIVTYAQKEPLTIDQLYFLANSCEGLLNDFNTQEITSEYQKQLCIYTCDQLITITECLENKDAALDNKLAQYRLILVDLKRKVIQPKQPIKEPILRQDMIDLYNGLRLAHDNDLILLIKDKISHIEQEYYNYIYERIKPTDFNCLKKRCQILLRHYQYNQARELLFEVLRRYRNNAPCSIAELCELQLLINQEELKPAQFLWQSYQQDLHAIRSTIPPYLQDSKQQLPSEWVDAVITFQEKFSISIINLVKRIFADCVDLLGAPPQPCAFTLMAQGSASRKEMAPYSDIECALLIEHRSMENQEYFLCLRKLFAFKMEVLGEYRPAGLHLDNEANPATEERLYGTVADIIKMNFESKLHSKDDATNHSLLNNIVIYATNKKLFTEYQQAIAQKQYQDQILARLKYLQRDPKKLLNLPIELANTFSLKGIFIAPLTYWLTELAAFHRLAANSFSAALQAGQGKIFHQDFVNKLKRAWAQITIIRYREQLFYRQQQEEKGQVEQVSFKNKDKYQLTRQEADWLKTIYQQLIYPIYSIINHWIKHEQLQEQVQQLKDFHPTLAAININILPNQAASLFLKNYAIFCREHKLSVSKVLEIYTKLPLGFRQKLREYLPEFQSRYYTFPAPNGERQSCQEEERAWQQELSEILIKENNYPSDLPKIEVKSLSYKEKRLLAPSIVKQLLEEGKIYANGHFKPKEEQPQAKKGRHLTIEIKGANIHLKVYPESPGTELLAGKLVRLISGHSAPHVELTKFIIGDQSYPVLISRSVTSQGVIFKLEDILENQALAEQYLIKQLSPITYSRLILASIALNNSDAKPNNYVVLIDKKGNTRLCCVDNERAFSQVIIRDKKSGKLMVNIKDLAFCLSQIETSSIAAEIREEFLALNLKELIKHWLAELTNYGQQVIEQQLFKPEEIKQLFEQDAEAMFSKFRQTIKGQKLTRHKCSILVPLAKTYPAELYSKLYQIQCLLKEQPEIKPIDIISHRQVMRHVGQYYQTLNSKHSTIAERFKQGFAEQYTDGGISSTSISESLSAQASYGQELTFKELIELQKYHELANKELDQIAAECQKQKSYEHVEAELIAHKAEGLRSLTKIPLPYYKVQIINGLDFQGMDSQYQEDIIKALLQHDINQNSHEISFHNCSVITAKYLQELTYYYPSLTTLKLIGCTNLKYLATRNLNSNLEKLYLNNCGDLSRININTPKLTHFSITRNKNLTARKIIIVAPNLRSLKLTDCINIFGLNDRDYVAFINRFPHLQELIYPAGDKGEALMTRLIADAITRNIKHDITKLKLLLKLGLNLDYQDKTGETFLTLAVMHNKIHIEEWLLENGINIHQSARSGQIKNLELLLRKGMSLEARDQAGNTALLSAVSAQKIESVRWILKRKASLAAQNRAGQTVFTLAYKANNREILGLLLAAQFTDPVKQIENIRVGDLEAELLAQQLSHNQEISHIELSNSKLTEKGVNSLVNLLEANENIISLKLEDKGISKAAKAKLSSRLLYNQGRDYEKRGQLQAVLASYNQAISQDSDYQRAWLHKGIVLIKLRRREQALDSLERILKEQPKHEQALSHYKRALAIPRIEQIKAEEDQLEQQNYQDKRESIIKQLQACKEEGLKEFISLKAMTLRVELINTIDFAQLKESYQKLLLLYIERGSINVEHLRLKNFKGLTAEDINLILRNYPNLQEFTIEGNDTLLTLEITPLKLKKLELKDWIKLEKLKIQGSQLKQLNLTGDIRLKLEGLTIEARELEELDIEGCKGLINNKLFFRMIENIPKLNKIRFANRYQGEARFLQLLRELERTEANERALILKKLEWLVQVGVGNKEEYSGQGLKTIASKQGKYREIEKNFSKAIKLHPNNIKYYINRAEAKSNLGKYKEGMEDYTTALNLVPRFINNQLEVKSRVLEGHSNWVNALTELRDGRLASGSNDHTIRIWDLSSGACRKILRGHSSSVSVLTELRDGRLAFGSGDETIRIWDLSSAACQKILKGHSNWVMALTELRDGRLASGSGDRTIRIWDLSSGACQKILTGHSDSVWALTELRDGRLASGSSDNTIRIWDLSSAACQKILKGHSRSVYALTKLRDGRLASGSSDNTIRIWDLSSAACQKILKGHSNWVMALTELRDGRLASGSYQEIRIWEGNNPQVADLYYKRAQLKFIFKHYREAIADYDAVILYKSNHVKAYCYRGIAQIKLQNITKAKADLEQVIKLAPKSIEAAEAYYRLAKIERNSAYYQTAFNILQEYIDNIEKPAEFTAQTKALFYKRLGVIYEKGRGTKQDPAKAIHYYQAIQTTGFFAHSAVQNKNLTEKSNNSLGVT